MKRAMILLALAACDGSRVRELPGAALAPQLRSTTPFAACGTDISQTEGGPTRLRYRFLYDAFGRLSFARGAYVDSSYEDHIEYRWDNLDQMSKMVERRGWDGGVYEIEALYSTLGDLVEYTARDDGQYERHVYLEHDARGLPARERIHGPGVPVDFALHYDAGGRLVLAASDVSTTVYTYDDDARTITIDTDDGAFRGVRELDDQNRQLVERWDGSDPSVIASEKRYAWTGDRLDRMTYLSGSEAAPRELAIVQIDTYLYDCDTVR